VPLYEYECQACHHRFEQIQLFRDPLVKVCPKCGKRRVKKLLSSPAIQFKGTGWYVTDYQRKGSGASLPDRPEGDKKKDSGEKETGKSSKDKETKPKSSKKD
jgi:putative FmdB family regulatory protein